MAKSKEQTRSEKPKSGRDEKGRFIQGNEVWILRGDNVGGAPPHFETPEQLWQEAKLYFESVDDNPFVSHEIVTTSKGQTTKEVYHRKPYQKEDLYDFLHVCDLERYKKKSEFARVLKRIDNKIYGNKAQGAYAGIFNANFAAREMGISDRTENVNENKNIEISDEEALRRYKALKKKINGGD